jgi:hypothetical protein
VKIRVRLRRNIAAGLGISVQHADVNTLISVNPDTIPTPPALTQAEFESMLAIAYPTIETSVYDTATFAAADAVAAQTSEVVEVCGLGSIEIITR